LNFHTTLVTDLLSGQVFFALETDPPIIWAHSLSFEELVKKFLVQEVEHKNGAAAWAGKTCSWAGTTVAFDEIPTVAIGVPENKITYEVVLFVEGNPGGFVRDFSAILVAEKI